MYKTILLVIFCLAIPASIYSQEQPGTKYWIYFKDKGSFTSKTKITPGTIAYETGKALLTEKAIQRRLKVLTKENLIDFGDLPLEEKYILEIKKLNIPLIAESRWLNGVSAYMTSAQVKKIKALEFVSEVSAVRKLFKQEFVTLFDFSFDEKNFLLPRQQHRFDYGKSAKQMDAVNVPNVHDINITGKGVFMANLDDGFEWRTHQALNNLSILGEQDFVNGDGNTFKEDYNKYPEQRSQGEHGTATLSCMSGKYDGKLISPSFDADILLAKTEYVSSETPMEEDFWLEACEWVEIRGVDIITSSLNYKIYDSPYDSNTYKYSDLNGNRAITTIAADRCAYLGIVVCNSIGNYYQTPEPSITTPADGDSVISVGAVNMQGKIAGFSSNGPTVDGRIKPDVVAPGVGVWVAVAKTISSNDSTYKYADGTSFAAPITAGVCGLILSAHPELTPMQVREALRNTANNSSSPNNVYGWGLINAYDAVLYWGPVWSNKPELEYKDDGLYIRIFLVSKEVIDMDAVNFSYQDQEGKKQSTAKLVDNLNEGNNSGLYEAFIPGLNPADKIPEYEFITVINGKAAKWSSKSFNR